MSIRFILLTTQRTGSTWVVDMLNSHPNVLAYSELFLKNGRGTPRWGGQKDLAFWETYAVARGIAGSPAVQPSVVEYLETLYSFHQGIQAIGFKLMYGQAGAYPAIGAYVREHQVRIVHLIRKNLLDVLLSREIAVQRDLFHARIADPVPVASVEIEPTTLLQRLSRLEQEVAAGRRLVRNLEVPHLVVSYEDLSHGPEGFGQVLSFLGVDRTAKLSSHLKKILPVEHRRLIRNYDHVHSTLQPTEYAGFLR